MDYKKTSYKGHVRHLDNEDGTKDLYSKYLASEKDNSVTYEYGASNYGSNLVPPLDTSKEKVNTTLEPVPQTEPVPQEEITVPSAKATALDWNHLRTFYYVAKAGSFTEAQQYLNVSQSTIRRTIQKLEKHVGEKVFLRSQSRLTLTHKGMFLFAGASILAGLSQCTRSFESLSAQRPQDCPQSQGDSKRP